MSSGPRDSIAVSAPGKLMLAGEYGVVLGGYSVVMAVNARAEVMLLGGPGIHGADSGSKLAREAVREAVLECGTADLGCRIEADTSTMYRNGEKLGLGSSAAVAVSVCAAVFEWYGRSCESPDSRSTIFACASRAQNRAQGVAGSGADLAASVQGGLLAYRKKACKRDGPAAEFEVEIRSLPVESLPPFCVVWSQKPSSTARLLKSFISVVDRYGIGGLPVLDDVSKNAEKLARAAKSGSRDGFLAAYEECAWTYKRLADETGLPLMDCMGPKVRDLVRECKGIVKPSGAGAGDLNVVFFEDERTKQKFSDLAAERGVVVLDLGADTDGVRREKPGRSLAMAERCGMEIQEQ